MLSTPLILCSPSSSHVRDIAERPLGQNKEQTGAPSRPQMGGSKQGKPAAQPRSHADTQTRSHADTQPLQAGSC
ncbi:hypothetical protein EYF80_053829 [Liparis tanakae]|uniref:Uncharacterized protein n=1 Tax=Liparis tanakae TaxID=230148 RepID=A0A4Z2F5J3_9TELE|nr:hypothetical protein EYF80_053829 [Liparis tanakae]